MTKKTTEKPTHTPGPVFMWTKELADLRDSGEIFSPWYAPIQDPETRYWKLPGGEVMAEVLTFGVARIYKWTEQEFAFAQENTHHIDPENYPRCFASCRACAKAEGK